MFIQAASLMLFTAASTLPFGKRVYRKQFTGFTQNKRGSFAQRHFNVQYRQEPNQ